MTKQRRTNRTKDEYEFDNVYNCDADERYADVDSSIWYN